MIPPLRMNANARGAFTTFTSSYPASIQCDTILHGKRNRSAIQKHVDTLLGQSGIVPTNLQRLPTTGNIVIPAPASMCSLPFWGLRASGLMSPHSMVAVIQALEAADKAGCRPFINPLKKAQAIAKRRLQKGLAALPSGGLRSDYEAPYHLGVFKHPNQTYDRPWVTKDTLQGFSAAQPIRRTRMLKTLAICKALDDIAMGPIQNFLRSLSPELLRQYQEFALLRRRSGHIVRHDMLGANVSGASLPAMESDAWPFLRFGNLGTAVAIGKGQSEKLHLDVHDDEVHPTILMVMGSSDNDWDRSQAQGDLVLPTLGLSIPLLPGDVFIFYASLLPHKVNMLNASDRHKRTVATLFTCGPTRQHLQAAEAEQVPPPRCHMPAGSDCTRNHIGA
jgi:hypothetical protein